MSVVIPWQNAAEFQFEITLDGTVYIVHAQWNETAGSWGLSLFTREMTPIMLGTRMLRNAALLVGSKKFLPPGQMMVMGEEPTYDKMIDGSSRLIYVTWAELNAL